MADVLPSPSREGPLGTPDGGRPLQRARWESSAPCRRLGHIRGVTNTIPRTSRSSRTGHDMAGAFAVASCSRSSRSDARRPPAGRGPRSHAMSVEVGTSRAGSTNDGPPAVAESPSRRPRARSRPCSAAGDSVDLVLQGHRGPRGADAGRVLCRGGRRRLRPASGASGSSSGLRSSGTSRCAKTSRSGCAWHVPRKEALRPPTKLSRASSSTRSLPGARTSSRAARGSASRSRALSP